MNAFPRVSDIKNAHMICAAQENPIVISPEATFLLRQLLCLTFQKTSNLSSVKKSKLKKYEKGEGALSLRDRRWLQATFEAAGAEFFTGQGELFVRLNGHDIITLGQRASIFDALPDGESCRKERKTRQWSQRETAKLSGVPQHIISAVENRRFPPAFMIHQCRLKACFEQNPAELSGLFMTQQTRFDLLRPEQR